MSWPFVFAVEVAENGLVLTVHEGEGLTANGIRKKDKTYVFDNVLKLAEFIIARPELSLDREPLP